MLIVHVTNTVTIMSATSKRVRSQPATASSADELPASKHHPVVENTAVEQTLHHEQVHLI